MKAKLVRGHQPECAFVEYAHWNRPPAWTLDPAAEWLKLDAAGGKRSTGHTWLPFICPDSDRCDALCLVELGSILDDLHALVGVPLANRASLAVRDGVVVSAASVEESADLIVTRLFSLSDGGGVLARRLVLELADGEFKGRVGWGRGPVLDVVRRQLRRLLRRDES